MGGRGAGLPRFIDGRSQSEPSGRRTGGTDIGGADDTGGAIGREGGTAVDGGGNEGGGGRVSTPASIFGGSRRGPKRLRIGVDSGFSLDIGLP